MRSRFRNNYQRLGFTLIELMVVIGILIILSSILVPTISSAFSVARSRKDMTQQRGIYQAMSLHASGDEGRFPLPSRIVDEKNPDPSINTTSALMSWMVMQKFFDYQFTISPVETNSNIRPIEAQDGNSPIDPSQFPYNFDIYDGDLYHWDPDFSADFTQGPAHSSYAHQALVGQRLRLKWHTGAGATDVIICNRGPELLVSLTGLSVVDRFPNTGDTRVTNTYGFHGSDEQWEGAAVMGDGTTRMLKSYVLDDVTYSPLDGTALRPDILFSTEFGDVDYSNPMASGDNWIIVTSNVNGAFTANETSAVWD
ncbi:prepilin-type N-terminal cleavage/methylation domain-containing protein [PVC group bacterium]|nr:prepilin-type N-terminal cleavage/methylation domain-containing protein [PVC group bacterium]